MKGTEHDCPDGAKIQSLVLRQLPAWAAVLLVAATWWVLLVAWAATL
jgi:hypothetical protein